MVANRSCFFLDTAARSDKGPYWARDNAFRAALKAVLLLGSLLFTWVLLFAEGVSPPVVGYDDKRRRSAALTGCAMFAVRLLWQMGWLWHRRITWAEVFAEAGMIIPASLGSLAWGATRKRSDAFGALDVLGCAVFLVGTAVNIISEHQRYVFKAEARNAGKLFAKGLWRLARHINYGGRDPFLRRDGDGLRDVELVDPFLHGPGDVPLLRAGTGSLPRCTIRAAVGPLRAPGPLECGAVCVVTMYKEYCPGGTLGPGTSVNLDSDRTRIREACRHADLVGYAACLVYALCKNEVLERLQFGWHL